MSYKIVHAIKKSKLPAPLKRVLEAYVSFGNADGTNIRPTQAKVGERASCSRRTVERYTPVLVGMGVLVHDRNEDGTYKTYNYPKPGVWAFVYHADIAPLLKPEVIAGFDFQREALSEKRRQAVAKASRNRSKMAETPPDTLAESPTDILAETPPDILSHRPEEVFSPRGSDQTQTDPSAVSTAVSKKESKQGSPSLAPLATAPSAAFPASRVNQNPNGSGLPAAEQHQPQEQHPPQTVQEFWQDGDYIDTDAKGLLFKLTPALTDTLVREQLPLCQRILALMPVDAPYSGLAADMLLDWNRAHRSGKYASKEDKRLYIRSARQFLAALESPTASLLNDYHAHDFERCPTCVEKGIVHYDTLIQQLVREEQERAEQERRRAEEERLAKLCPLCKQNEPSSMALHDGSSSQSHRVCDPCYDRAYEAQQNDPHVRYSVSNPRLEPRPGYQPPKFDLTPTTQNDFLAHKEWFKEHGKDGEWAITPEELQALSANTYHMLAVIRYVRRNNLKVTKDEFIDLLLECAGKKAADAPAGFNAEAA